LHPFLEVFNKILFPIVTSKSYSLTALGSGADRAAAENQNRRATKNICWLVKEQSQENRGIS
jgi:hypothetical protein